MTTSGLLPSALMSKPLNLCSSSLPFAHFLYAGNLLEVLVDFFYSATQEDFNASLPVAT